jgi:hypothetical protein
MSKNNRWLSSYTVLIISIICSGSVMGDILNKQQKRRVLRYQQRNSAAYYPSPSRCVLGINNFSTIGHSAGDGVSAPKVPYIRTSFTMTCGPVNSINGCKGYIRQIVYYLIKGQWVAELADEQVCKEIDLSCGTVQSPWFAHEVPTAKAGTLVQVMTYFRSGGDCILFGGTDVIPPIHGSASW